MSAPLDRELPLLTESASGCACCAPDIGSKNQAEHPQPEQPPGLTAAAEYRVAGMTCGHCASSITEVLSALDGVRDVQIDLVPGGISTVTLAAARPLDEDAVRSAVAEAGYELITS
ncbi:heavy-metal-associated domain-containing protein [Arthrobacter sulfonylureivorans]|uniref:heavy-metal-associated domain-containing protein n=1 Tax=Arthrobacter sulfonylureivorans TaxID=2486855 RepID=UPI0039E3470C